jgi:isoquinoline 1-oxidoreductase beta subunit
MKLDRRKFLKLSAYTAGTSLVIGINLSCSDQLSSNKSEQNYFTPNVWLRFSKEQGLVIIVSESEMGQGVYTSLPMILAEEFCVDWLDINIERASTHPMYGFQITAGSDSVKKAWKTMREAGAIAREIMITAGSKYLQVPPDECVAKSGEIIHKASEKKVKYHNLLHIASKLKIPEYLKFKNIEEYEIVGTSLPRLDIPNKLNGSAVFGMDVKLKGMVYATIGHCPYINGSLKSINKKKAMAVAGVLDVFEIDEGVIVVAEDTWSAFRGLREANLQWEDKNERVLSDDAIKDHLNGLSIEEANNVVEIGDQIKNPLKDDYVRNQYILPFQAHATMEPMNCTATLKNEVLEIWVPTQSPSLAYEVAKDEMQKGSSFRMVEKIKNKIFKQHDHNIIIHTTLLGGGFGRRLQQDYVAEAVKITKRIKKPVQLVWTKEEDIQNDYYHPYSIHELSGKVDENGRPHVWKLFVKGIGIGRGNSAKIPYEIENISIKAIDVNVGIKTGAWRSIAEHYHTYACEHFFDELVKLGGRDPLEMRIDLLRKNSRLKNVLEVVADKGGWGKSESSDLFQGVAVRSAFGSHVALVAIVRIDGNKIKVKKLICAIDCGIIINPDTVVSQIESSIIFGLTAALKSSINIENNGVKQTNLHDYKLLRMYETPGIEVIIVKSNESPGGVGELAVPPVAPAIANAILAATGKATTTLPIILKK